MRGAWASTPLSHTPGRRRPESRTDKTICLADLAVVEGIRSARTRPPIRSQGETDAKSTRNVATARARRIDSDGHIVLRRRRWKPIRAWRSTYTSPSRECRTISTPSAKNIRHLPAVRLRGRHPRLFGGRGVHGRHAAICAPMEKGWRRLTRDIIRDDPHPDRHHRHRGHRHQPVPGQSGHGHRGQTHSRRGRTAFASPGLTRCRTGDCSVESPAAYRFLACGAWICKEARSARTGDHGGYRSLFTLAVPTNTTTKIYCTRLFGVNAELLIDHAWGWEPCTIADIKAYKPAGHSCEFRTSADQGRRGFDAARLIVQ